MTEILNTKALKDKLEDNMIQKIKMLKEKGKVPTLTTVRVGDSPDDISYENSLIKKCNKYEINIENLVLDENISTDNLIEEIKKLNTNKSIDGIMMFRPLPKQIDEDKVIWKIDYKKDADASNPINMANVFLNNKESFKPATPYAVMTILDYFNINLEGKDICVINRSEVFGKPMALMLLEKDATVTICHSKTKNLKEICKSSDIIITAMGRAKIIDKDYVNKESIIIDVGVSLDKEGNLSGDCDFENINNYVAKITPRKQGVGLITSTLLIKQVIDSIK